MKYSVRTRVGDQIGSHDTVWDDIHFMDNGWIQVFKWANSTRRVVDERFYPPTSVYSVKPVKEER